MKIKIQRLTVDSVVPVYAHGSSEDAGMDLYAAEEVILEPFQPVLVKTGLAVEIPAGYEGQVRPRSGLALKRGITVWNAPGTIDPSYRGEVGVILFWNGMGNGVIRVGERIAQLIVAKYEAVEWEPTNDLADSSRGDGGFGSTGS